MILGINVRYTMWRPGANRTGIGLRCNGQLELRGSGHRYRVRGPGDCSAHYFFDRNHQQHGIGLTGGAYYLLTGATCRNQHGADPDGSCHLRQLCLYAANCHATQCHRHEQWRTQSQRNDDAGTGIQFTGYYLCDTHRLVFLALVFIKTCWLVCGHQRYPGAFVSRSCGNVYYSFCVC